MPAPTLAIDFGTTRTKVAYFDSERNEPRLMEIGREIRTIVPSVFYVPHEGQGRRLVGDDAQEQVEIDPEGIVIGLKKDIHRLAKIRCGPGRPSVGRIELASDLFAYVREQCREVFPGEEATRCVLTVPVSFEEQKRECIRKAAEQAGFRNIALVDEPVAAAKAWLASAGQNLGDHVIVCDVGGGTTDFALLRYVDGHFEPVPDVPAAGFGLGGNDVDEDILTNLREESPQDEEAITKRENGFLIKVRRIKELLLRQQRDQAPLSLEGTVVQVSRNAVSKCAARFIDRVADELKRFLDRAIVATKMKNIPILLAGGGSRLPGLKERLESFTQANVYQWSQADYATVLGAVEKPVVPTGASNRTNASAAVENAAKTPVAAKTTSIEDIRNLISDGRAEKAFEIVSKAIVQTPTDRLFEIWCDVADVMADSEKILAVCREAHRRREGDVWASCCLAHIFVRLGRLDEAQRILEPFLNAPDAEIFPVLYLRFELVSEMECREEAMALLKKLLALRPNCPVFIAHQALRELEQNNLTACDQLLKRAATLDSNNLTVANADIAVAFAQETKQEALADKIRSRLAVMERVSPNHALTRLARARYFLVGQQYREALRELDEAAQLPEIRGNNSSLAFVFQQRAYCHQALIAEEDLRHDVDEWLGRDPKCVEARIWRGNLRLTDKKCAEALDDFNKALESDPSLLDAWIGRGTCLMGQGNFREGVNAFESAYRTSPGNMFARYGATIALIYKVLSEELGRNPPDSRIYIGSSIPKDKLVNVQQSYAAGELREDSGIALLFDNTLWGGAKDGFCISEDKLMAHNLWEDKNFAVPLAQINSVRRNLNDLEVNGFRIMCGKLNNPSVGIRAFATMLNELGVLHRRLDGYKAPEIPSPPGSAESNATLLQTFATAAVINNSEHLKGEESRCPNCGFGYKWDGNKCDHCGF